MTMPGKTAWLMASPMNARRRTIDIRTDRAAADSHDDDLGERTKGEVVAERFGEPVHQCSSDP